MQLTEEQAQEIKDKLAEDKNYIVVCPTLAGAVELVQIHGLPEDRVRALACIERFGDYVILSKRQYGYYSRKEKEILEKAGAAGGKD